MTTGVESGDYRAGKYTGEAYLLANDFVYGPAQSELPLRH